jgi:hypothetical protein
MKKARSKNGTGPFFNITNRNTIPGVDAVGGSSNQFREDVMRLYELSEYIHVRESSL